MTRLPTPAQVRKDAALVARIERAWWRQTRDEQDGRNDAARFAARRFVEAWLYQNQKVSRAGS